MDTKLLRTTAIAALAVAVVAGAAACGSATESGDGLTPMQREDRAASASTAGLLQFANAQIGNATADNTEPRSIDGIAPPVDDTAEPFVI